MLKSKDCDSPDLKIPIDVLLDNMTRDEHINLLFKVFDRLSASTQAQENDHWDKVRKSQECNFQKEGDSCSGCDSGAERSAPYLNTQLKQWNERKLHERSLDGSL